MCARSYWHLTEDKPEPPPDPELDRFHDRWDYVPGLANKTAVVTTARPHPVGYIEPNWRERWMELYAEEAAKVGTVDFPRAWWVERFVAGYLPTLDAFITREIANPVRILWRKFVKKEQTGIHWIICASYMKCTRRFWRWLYDRPVRRP